MDQGTRKEQKRVDASTGTFKGLMLIVLYLLGIVSSVALLLGSRHYDDGYQAIALFIGTWLLIPLLYCITLFVKGKRIGKKKWCVIALTSMVVGLLAFFMAFISLVVMDLGLFWIALLLVLLSGLLPLVYNLAGRVFVKYAEAQNEIINKAESQRHTSKTE